MDISAKRVNLIDRGFGIHMELFSVGSSLTYHLAPFVCNATTTFHTYSCGIPQGSVLGMGARTFQKVVGSG